MEKRNWEELDFILISGDAYIDHPSFGTAIIARKLEKKGFKIGIIAQPDWKNPEAFKILGKPNYAFLVSSGNIDSMVNHYSVNKKTRRTDSYTPNNEAGKRPDRAVIVYTSMIKQAYKNIPVILGGIEASLRRLSHYDYWSNKVRHSILIDSKADLLVYGMAEKQIINIAKDLASGKQFEKLYKYRGIVYKTKNIEKLNNKIVLPSFEEIKANKKSFAKSFLIQYENTDPFYAKTLCEDNGSFYVVQNPSEFPLNEKELDEVYNLPFNREAHPNYRKIGEIPALREVKYSISSSRGCFGSCSFCALTFHQGRIVSSRSHESILNEAKKFEKAKDFKGYIHDLGGPTANFRKKACKKQETKGTCKNKKCLFPEPCKNLEIDHSDYLKILRKLRKLPFVKKVFIRSGIRFDYLMADKNDQFFNELCEYHISGQLKVAPEHISKKVLKLMQKPDKKIFVNFVNKFKKINARLNKKQYIIPYLISSHPGSDLKAAIELAEFLRDFHFIPEQVQDFYPTPGTLSTCMYYTELDPRTMQSIYVAKNPEEKIMQRALLQFNKKENHKIIRKALQKEGRQDLINGNKALVPKY